MLNFGETPITLAGENRLRQTTKMVVCKICYEVVPFQKRFKHTSSNSHHKLYCTDCIEKHIQAKLQDHNLAEIKCPSFDCKMLLDPLECRSFLSADVFERWCDALCQKAVSHVRKAYCPFSNCSTLILDECSWSTQIMKTRCPSCKNLFCFNCSIPWHAGYGCDEAKGMTNREDILFGKLKKKKKWQRCPSCRACVERISGCSIITCRCNVQFCYLCGRVVGLLCPCRCYPLINLCAYYLIMVFACIVAFTFFWQILY